MFCVYGNDFLAIMKIIKWSGYSIGVVCLLLLCNGSVNAQRKKGKPIPITMANGLANRQFWLAQMDKICRPMLRSLAHDSLRINMPTTVSAHVDNAENRRKVAYLEITGRVLSGVAPFLARILVGLDSISENTK